jgi:flavin-binding protein dodecin
VRVIGSSTESDDKSLAAAMTRRARDAVVDARAFRRAI